MEEPKLDVPIEVEIETTTDEAGNEKSERSHGEEDGGEEDQTEIATDEAIDENYGGNNDEEGGEGAEEVNHDNVLMETEVDGDDLEESDPNVDISDPENEEYNLPHQASEDDEEYNLPHQGSKDDEEYINLQHQDSEDDEAYENEVEGEVDEDGVSEDDEPIEEEFDDEDFSEEEASEEGGAESAEGEKEIVEREGENGGRQDPKEKKIKSKDANKSRKRSNGQADKSVKIESADKPEPSRCRNGKAKVKSMGMIFLCSSKTKDDCFKYRVFGLPDSKKDVVDKIYRGMRLFLYDVDLKLMYGIYKAAGPGGHNIEPKAFKSQFPSQVRYTVLTDCLPLAEEKFKKVIKKNYFTKTKFDCKLNSLQVKELCKLFVASSRGLRRTRPGREPKAPKLLPLTQDRTQKEKPIRKRRPAPREELDRRERPRKRARKVISPHSPPTVPSYAYERTSIADSYRQDVYSKRDRTHRDDHDPRLLRRDPYRDDRVPLLERRDSYRDAHDSYRVVREPYVDRYREGRDSYLEPCDPYKERRGESSYIERIDPYKERRGESSYIERIDPYRDARYQVRRDPYIDRLDTYVERGDRIYHDDLYRTSFKMDPIVERSDGYRDGGRVEYRDIYRGGEPFDRIESRPLSVASSRRLEIGPVVSPRERPPLYSESLYSLSRAPLSREYRL